MAVLTKAGPSPNRSPTPGPWLGCTERQREKRAGPRVCVMSQLPTWQCSRKAPLTLSSHRVSPALATPGREDAGPVCHLQAAAPDPGKVTDKKGPGSVLQWGWGGGVSPCLER